MAITRRQFIKRSALAAAGTAFGPALFRHPLVRQAMAAAPDKYFIVLFLDGGNDGQNTVVPYDNPGPAHLRDGYNTARPNNGGGSIHLFPTDLLIPTLPFKDLHSGTQLGLHPGLAGINTLYNLGKVAVIQGCGYPDYSLSHEESRLTWQTGQPGLGVPTGWLGRYLMGAYGALDIPAVCIAGSIQPEFMQSVTNVLAIDNLENFSFPYDYLGGDDETQAKRDAFDALYASARAQVQATVQYVGAGGKAMLDSSESYQALDQEYLDDRQSWSDQYDSIGRSTANDLRDIAKIIYGVSRGHPVPPKVAATARIFELRNGGYDTHSDQGAADPNAQQYGLHKEVGDSIELFYQDMVDMGLASKVCILAYSEFSRRIVQNDSGTDHGSQGPVFVIGGGVTGGAYGNHPNINDPAVLDKSDPGYNDGNTPYSQVPVATDPYRSTDIRDIYGTILKHWLGMTAAAVQAVLPLDTSGTVDDHWKAANFDLGFV